MNTFIRLMPVIFACAATQVFAGDPTTPNTIDPDKPAAPAVTADTASQATPSPAKAVPPDAAAAVPAKPQRLVLEDKTLTNAEVSQLLSQGYKPQKGRGDDVLYCRSEQQLGTRFAKKICKTADQIKTQIQDSKDMAERQQRPSGNAPGK